MTFRRLLPAALAIVLLNGCAFGDSAKEAAEQLRNHYEASPSLQAEGEVLAEYGQRAYCYTVEIQGSEEAGSLTVTAPESIAGTGTAWQNGETVLDYEGISLETGALSPDGLSPADGIPVLLCALRSGSVAEYGWTDWGEAEHCLYLLLDNPNTENHDSQIAVWGDAESGTLYHAELLWQEKRVLSFTFSRFVLQ